MKGGCELATKNSKKKAQQKASKKLSVAERRKHLERLDSQMYAAQLAKLMVSDIGKKATRTYTQYTKENYRTYIQNPSSNEKNIREMSNFFYRASMPYRRFVNYMSDIPLFYWNLTPQLDFTSTVSPDKILKNYYKILQILQNMSMPHEFRKILNTVFREGIFYGFIYTDKNSFFIHKLDPEYCRIVEIEAGCFNYAFDLSFFDKYATYLEYMDPYFTTLYNVYQRDKTNQRWQLVDPQRSICIKTDPDNVDENLPMLIGIFEALIDLIDARTLQRSKDEIQNYKLIVQKIPYFDDTKEVDDFSLDIETALKFYRTLVDVVPEAVGVALSPMDVDTIDFKTDDNSNDLIATSMNNVFDESGLPKLLFNSNTTGSVGLDGSIKTDVAWVWKTVECLERWVQRYIMYNTTGNTKYFFEILRVDIFNRDAVSTHELALANSGVPNKMKLAATSGMNPYETLSAQIFENEVLQLHMKWIPLQTSYTQSGEADAEIKEPNDEGDRNADANGNVDEVE